MRKTTTIALALTVALALSSCGRNGGEPAEGPAPGAHLPEQTTVAPTQTMAPLTAPEELPRGDNQEIDWGDPTSVAVSWAVIRSTFLAGDIMEPGKVTERSNVAVTDGYRERNAPVSNPDVVHTRSWFHLGEKPGDPVVSVTGEAELALRAEPVFGDEDQAVRDLLVTQTPVAESGAQLPKRKQRVLVTLVREGDRWLVDDASFRDA